MTTAAGLVPVHEYTLAIASDGETRTAAMAEAAFMIELCDALGTSRDRLTFDYLGMDDGRKAWAVRRGSRKRPVAMVRRGPLEFRRVAP